jgi:hypothetical protein
VSSRSARTLIIHSLGRLDHLTHCLDRVTALAAPGDRIVVASAPSAPVLSKVRSYRSVEHVVITPTNLSSVIMAAGEQGPVVVLEEHAWVLDKRWMGTLVQALIEHDVVVPISNGAPAPQCPRDSPGLVTSKDELRSLARKCAQTPDREPFVLVGASGPAIALSAQLASRLPARLLNNSIATIARACNVLGHDVWVMPSVYVHATTGLLLISQCMIMKNETAFLAANIGSNEGLVDEVVIYDTGSDDGSVALARALGASVIEGYWDASFSRARNESLVWCRGEMVMAADPDETLERNANSIAGVRQLFADGFTDAFCACPIESMAGTRLAASRSGFNFPAGRFMKRTTMHWTGGLHEQAARRDGGQFESMHLSGPTFLHFGYLSDIIADRDKAARNVAAMNTEDDCIDDGGKHRFDLARSLSMQGDSARPKELFAWVVANDTNIFFKRAAHEALFNYALADNDLDAAHQHVEALAAVSDHRSSVQLMSATLAGLEERYEEGLAHMEGWVLVNDRFTAHTLCEGLLLQAKLHSKLDHVDEAADLVVQAIESMPAAVEAWQLFAGIVDVTSPHFARAIAVPEPSQFTAACTGAQSSGPNKLDAIIEAFWDRAPGTLSLLVLAAELSMALPLDRAAVWAERLRIVGLHNQCPLRAIVSSSQQALLRRAEAAAIAVEWFDDEQAQSAFEDLVPQLSATEASEFAETTKQRYPRAWVAMVNVSVATIDQVAQLANEFTLPGSTSHSL